jgi:hypothetical protein
MAVESTQGASNGQGKATLIQSKAKLWCETAGKHEAPGYPGLLSAQELGDGCRSELILIGKGGHNSGLVHGTRGLPGSVGFENPGLPGDAGDGLDHDGDLSASLTFPDDQAFETVDDLEGAAGRRGNPNRHGSQVALAVGVLTSEGSQGGVQLLHRDPENDTHFFGSSTGRS